MLIKKKKVDFPHDADGDTLRRIHSRGVDFSVPHSVNFPVAVKTEQNGKKLLPVIEGYGFTCSLEPGTESTDWTIDCTKDMLLDHKELAETQELLNSLGEPFGAYSDGWGTFGD